MISAYESVVNLLNYCSDGKENWVAFDTTPYCSTSAIDQALPLLSEIVASLHSLNIVVEQVLNQIQFYIYVLGL